MIVYEATMHHFELQSLQFILLNIKDCFVTNRNMLKKKTCAWGGCLSVRLCGVKWARFVKRKRAMLLGTEF